MTQILHQTAADQVAVALTDTVDGTLVCTAVADITHDVRSFTFAMSGGQGLAFDAGQYLTLRLPLATGTIDRCYTISSPPTLPAELTITVKRVPDGPGSNWLHDHLGVGDTLAATGPYGEFSHERHPAQHYLFLSAGSGITPSMSMLRSMIDRGSTAAVTFVHCARTPADIIFRAELEALESYHGITVTTLCEEDSATETWSGPRGRLSPLALLTAAPELVTTEIFVCGPAPYMAAVRSMLDLLGVDPARYHEESFALGGAGVAAPAPSTGATTTHQVRFERSDRVVECDESTSLLTAAARSGLTLPSSCGEGVCGTCKTKLLSGRVDMQHGGGIRKREIDQGQILLCSSTPQEDLVIDA